MSCLYSLFPLKKALIELDNRYEEITYCTKEEKKDTKYKREVMRCRWQNMQAQPKSTWDSRGKEKRGWEKAMSSELRAKNGPKMMKDKYLQK